MADATRRRIMAVIPISLLMGLLAGCSGVAPDGRQGEPPIDVQQVASSADVNLPLVSFAASAEDQDAFFAAVNVAQRRCTARYGVEFTETGASDQPVLAEEASERRYGLSNEDEVRRFGYDSPPAPGDTGENDKHGPDAWNPSARELLIVRAATADGAPVSEDPVTGKELPAGGCGAQGWRDVLRGQEGPSRSEILDRLLMESWESTKADSRALEAEAAWSDCMAQRGHEGFKHRWEAGNSVAGDAEAMFEMAQIDLECAYETDYLSVWHAVDVAYQERLIEQHAAELDAYQRGLRDVMERVHAILEEGE